MIRLTIANLLIVFLFGCQTTQSIERTEDVVRLENMMNQKCGVRRDLDGYQTQTDAPFTAVSMASGEGGWVSLTAVVDGHGFMDNFYYNEDTNASICGSNAFRSRGYRFIRVD